MAEQRNILSENAPLILIGGLGIGAYVFIIKPLLETLGLKDSSEDKAYAKEKIKLDKTAFDPKFINNAPKGSGMFNAATGKALAQKLYDAKGFFNDNEDKVFGVFKQCKAKSDVSTIAYYFNSLYSKDLHSYLDFLDQAEMTKVQNIIDDLPNYRKATNVTATTTKAKVAAATKKVTTKFKLNTGKI